MMPGMFSEYWVESSCQVCGESPLEPTIEGRSWEQRCSQSVGVVFEPLAVGDAVGPYFLPDGRDA
jgi:hypothetical protein